MQPLPLAPDARRLAAQLEALSDHTSPVGPMYHAAGIGGGFYFAYEQLRNAAAYREHHLLLRSAIERFLTRMVKWRHHQPLAAELVSELTHSGYLKNDTVPMSRIRQIDELLERYYRIYDGLITKKKIRRDTAETWLYQVASSHLEDYLTPNRRLTVFMAFAYDHYLTAIDAPIASKGEDELSYPVALYSAVQRAIFKSDIATTRYYCLAAQLAHLPEQGLDGFVRTNNLLDMLYQAPQTNRLVRLISRYGAPMRVLRELVVENGASAELLADRSGTLGKLKRLTQQQYLHIRGRLKGQIIKAVLFILITKTLLGVSIEVPYDLLVHDMIAWTPLVLNILFPVLYMILIAARITMPDRQNTELVVNYADRILYDGAGAPMHYRSRTRVASSSLRAAFSAIYAVGFLLSFGLLMWGLYALHFNIVNGIIFFVFLSAVSFLGFRLRQSSRELAVLDERQSLIQALADFLSTPFIRVGYWLSDRYSRLNVVAVLLDMAIEMPLKTTLRLVGQWVGFMRDKQEEL